MQLWRLFVQHYCKTLGRFLINWATWFRRVSYLISHDQGERRTNPAGLKAGSYSHRPPSWRIEM